MRPADINRALKAREHLKAAQTLIDNIKWEKITLPEDAQRMVLKESLRGTMWQMEDFIRIGGGKV